MTPSLGEWWDARTEVEPTLEQLVERLELLERDLHRHARYRQAEVVRAALRLLRS